MERCAVTQLMYIDSPALFQTSAQVVSSGVDEKGGYLILTQTIFYPQGGGQPADQGKIMMKDKSYDVYDARYVGGDVRHYLTSHPSDVGKGCMVVMAIDPLRRGMNTQYHTGGHLLAAVVEKVFPHVRVVKGHQFPGEAYIECDGVIEGEEDIVLDALQTALVKAVEQNASVTTRMMEAQDIKKLSENVPYALPEDKPLRVCDIEGFGPVPCGGTHVDALGDIATIRVIAWKSKKGKTKVSYEIK